MVVHRHVLCARNNYGARARAPFSSGKAPEGVAKRSSATTHFDPGQPPTLLTTAPEMRMQQGVFGWWANYAGMALEIH